MKKDQKNNTYVFVYIKETDGDIGIKNLNSKEIKSFLKYFNHLDYMILDGIILKDFNSKIDLNKL